MISRLFHDFLNEEAEMTLLFLRNISHISIQEIGADGSPTSLAEISITRSPSTSMDTSPRTLTATTTLTRHHSSQTQNWRILHTLYPQTEAVELLSQEPGSNRQNLQGFLKFSKLAPEIAIAANMDRPVSGRLFTYLPLSISSGLPIHVHALFALDLSRRHLRNHNDIGLQPGSRDQ